MPSESLAIYSYIAAATAFGLLWLLLLTSWRGRLRGAVLALACLVQALWAGASAWQAQHAEAPVLLDDLMEVARSGVWFIFILMLLGYAGSKDTAAQRSLRVLGVSTLIYVFALGLVTAFAPWGHGAVLGVDGVFAVQILGRLALAIVGMALVEQLFRHVAGDQLWAIKFLCLGLGSMFAYDFYLYADAMLFRRVGFEAWSARGVINAMVAPLIAVSAARNPSWSLDISVSRRILYQSASLVGAGVYLLFMAAAGYYIRYFGGNWGAVLQAVFLFGAMLLLVAVMFSGTMRARLKVFLSKHFFSYKFDYREEWLQFTQTLSAGEPGVRLHERSIQAIGELVESPGGALWLATESGEFIQVAHWNMPSVATAEPATGSLIHFLRSRKWVIDLSEYASQPAGYPGLDLPAWLRAIPSAWLVVPLILHEQLTGLVILAQSRGQIQVNWEVCDLLKTSGRQAASYLAQLEAAKALLVARQFESFNRMSAFVIHDLKNLVAQLSLLLSNADKHKHKPAFQQDMLETVALSVEKMNRLLAQLRSSGRAVEPPIPLDLDQLVADAAASKAGFEPTPIIEILETVSVMGTRERLLRVIGHVIQNAIEATPREGTVNVKLYRDSKFAVVEVSDSGRGMSEEFVRDGLFKPFETTKSTGMGIGMYESREYVKELGGAIEVSSTVGVGTRVMLRLPARMVEISAQSGPELGRRSA